jgi:hypothetical protein
MTDEKDVFSEPTQVNTMYVSGVKLTLEGVNIVVTSWQDIEGERRVVWRSLVPIKTAQDVYRQLAFLLGKADADR